MKKHQSQRGAALLIALLVASVALAVGIGVYQRTYKELLFSSFWKQTQVAFAAADAGLECALYWDLNHGPATEANCFGATISGWNPSLNASANFTINMPAIPICVNIDIVKVSTPPSTATTIRARGYNTCDTANPRRVERGLRIDYTM